MEFAQLVDRLRSSLSATGREVPPIWGPPRDRRVQRCLAGRGTNRGIAVEYRDRSESEVTEDLVVGLALLLGESASEIRVLVGAREPTPLVA